MALKPPVEVPQGAIRVNTDSQKIEFYAQDQWWEMATEPSAPLGSRGVFGGGQTPTVLNTIDYITITTAGNAVNFGDLTRTSSLLGSCSSNTRGLWGGDYPSAGNVMDYYKALRGESGDGEFKSQSEVKGHDLRNAIKGLNFYSLSFQELNDAFGMATQSYKKTLLLEEE